MISMIDVWEREAYARDPDGGASVQAKTVVLPYPPSNNHYKRHYCTVDPTHRIGVYHQGPAKVFLGQIGLIEWGKPYDGPVSVKIAVYRPRKSGDLDNLLKVLLDVLQGRMYANDSQIARLEAVRLDDKANPRVEVWVEPYKD